ncbi:MAG: RsmE family RNA methyltransferase [bacterium]
MAQKDFFYVRPEDVVKDSLTLQKDEFHHLIHVHRKKTGDSFLAIDGIGTLYDCQIEELEKDSLKARILKKRRNVGEPVFQLTLALALLKKARFDWVVEKGTEIGISKFIPVLSNQIVVSEYACKPERWQRIALAAMKQCGRSCLPTIETPKPIETICENCFDYGLKLIAHEKYSGHNLNDIFKSLAQKSHLEFIKSGILLLGPEGGFTDEEVEMALRYGFSAFTLGSRRLRSETAALVGSALILDRMDELS